VPFRGDCENGWKRLDLRRLDEVCFLQTERHAALHHRR
jgi:hypothetical protein